MMKTSRASQAIESRPFSIPSRVRWSTGGAEFDSDIHLLNRVAKRMSSAAPLPDVLKDVVEFVSAVVKCDSCMIYVLEGDTLVLRASKNPHVEVVDRLQMSVGARDHGLGRAAQGTCGGGGKGPGVTTRVSNYSMNFRKTAMRRSCPFP